MCRKEVGDGVSELAGAFTWFSGCWLGGLLRGGVPKALHKSQRNSKGLNDEGRMPGFSNVEKHASTRAQVSQGDRKDAVQGQHRLLQQIAEIVVLKAYPRGCFTTRRPIGQSPPRQWGQQGRGGAVRQSSSQVFFGRRMCPLSLAFRC